MRAIFEPQKASKCDIWRFIDFHQKLRILCKNALEFIFLQNAALFHQTVLVASEFGVTESIPVNFGVPRGILDALEQFLSLKMRYLEVYGFHQKSRILGKNAIEFILSPKCVLFSPNRVSCKSV